MFRSVVNFLNAICPLPESFESRLSIFLFSKVFSSNDLLLKEGQVCRNVYFIKRGLVRAYMLKTNKEINSWFMMENDVIVAVDSFFGQTPSLEYMEAIEDTEVIGLSYENLQLLYDEFWAFERIGRRLTEKYYAQTDTRLKSLIGSKPKDRYQYLLSHHPNLLQRVPVALLASYLGMSSATLSRARSKL